MRAAMERVGVNGVELECQCSGTGDSVLLIHGSHIAGSFIPLIAEMALAPRFQFIRLHRRGFAGSAPVSGAFTIEQQAADCRALLESLGVKRAHVVGHSYGGVIALQLAAESPALVRSLVLLEPALVMVPSSKAFFESVAPAIERYASGDATGAVDAFMKLVGGQEWRKTVGRSVPGGPEQAEKDARTFFEVELPALGSWTFDAAKARRISCPVLYVIGAGSGPLFEEGRQLIHSWFPQTRDLVLPDANHLLQMQNPSAVAKGVSEFLALNPS
jgi:pimeloyl-ACP methyl ester carboxylesterase